jgi:hypothetical protein
MAFQTSPAKAAQPASSRSTAPTPSPGEEAHHHHAKTFQPLRRIKYKIVIDVYQAIASLDQPLGHSSGRDGHNKSGVYDHTLPFFPPLSSIDCGLHDFLIAIYIGKCGGADDISQQ